MLGEELVDAEGLGGAGQVIERGVAFAQGDGVAKAIQNGQQLAETPDAGVVERLGRAAPLAPEPLERAGIGAVRSPTLAPAGIFNLEKLAANGATEVGQRVSACNACPTAKTA